MNGRARHGHLRRVRPQRPGSAGAGDGGHRHDGPAAAGVPARHILHVQHLAVADHPAGRDLRAPRARIRRLPHGAAGRDAVAARLERRIDAHRPHERAQRRPRGGARHRGVRPVRGGRKLRGGHGGVHRAGDHQLRGHHQGRRPHLGGQRPVHPGRHAGPANGHRRRPERRNHHAGRGRHAPARGPRGGGFLRRHGRRQQVRARRCRGGHSHRIHQPVRRHHHRRRPARTVARRSRAAPTPC